MATKTKKPETKAKAEPKVEKKVAPKASKDNTTNMLLRLPNEAHAFFKNLAVAQKKTLSGLLESWIIAKIEKKAAKVAK